MANNISKTRRKIWFPEARIYYSRDAERRFFFIMTVGMAVLGLAIKFGWI